MGRGGRASRARVLKKSVEGVKRAASRSVPSSLVSSRARSDDCRGVCRILHFKMVYIFYVLKWFIF